MKKRIEPLESTEMTSMIDIIFQLMIFFLVTLSIMPSVKSAPQVEGMMNLPTPKKGESEASMLIQFHKTPQGQIDYYVLRGDDNSAEFYNWFQDKRSLLSVGSAYIAFRNAVTRYQVLYNEQTLEGLINEVAVNEPAVILRAPSNLEYGEIVKVTGLMYGAGISKIAWVRGSMADLKVEIKKRTARRQS